MSRAGGESHNDASDQQFEQAYLFAGEEPVGVLSEIADHNS